MPGTTRKKLNAAMENNSEPQAVIEENVVAFTCSWGRDSLSLPVAAYLSTLDSVVMKILLNTIVLIGLFTGALYIAKSSIRQWYETPIPFDECVEAGKIHVKVYDKEDFELCLTTQAKKYLSYDYPEFKEMVKVFLTLLSATLVASITFSEKVVNIHTAPSIAISALVACWCLLLGAITACVAGLAFMANAAWIAQYDPNLNFLVGETLGVSMLMYSVGSFVAALSALMIAGIISLVTRNTFAEKQSENK